MDHIHLRSFSDSLFIQVSVKNPTFLYNKASMYMSKALKSINAVMYIRKTLWSININDLMYTCKALVSISINVYK